MRGVTKVYRMGDSALHALAGISLDIGEGDFVAIMGASGSGKSTLMNILGCLDRPTAGSYRLAGEEVEQLGPNALARLRNRTIGFVFQGFHLLARTTAQENVELPLLYAGVPARERHRRARAALEEVGLGARLHHYPNQLSGGQQQRVAIARALVTRPRIILADEPTGNLDSRTSIEVMALLQDLNRRGMTIAMVTHELDIAAYAARVVVVRDGKIVSSHIQSPAPAVLPEVPHVPRSDPTLSHGPGDFARHVGPSAASIPEAALQSEISVNSDISTRDAARPKRSKRHTRGGRPTGSGGHP